MSVIEKTFVLLQVGDGVKKPIVSQTYRKLFKASTEIL